MFDDKITHFTQLEARKKNHELVLNIYKTTKKFPTDEMFGLVSQIRRSASSITANIAEGYGRRLKKDKNRFYQIACGSNAETQNHLILAKDLGYLEQADYLLLKGLVWDGYKLIIGLIRSTERNLVY